MITNEVAEARHGGIIALADIALHIGKNVAGHIVNEMSEPTSSSSAAFGSGPLIVL